MEKAPSSTAIVLGSTTLVNFVELNVPGEISETPYGIINSPVKPHPEKQLPSIQLTFERNTEVAYAKCPTCKSIAHEEKRG